MATVCVGCNLFRTGAWSCLRVNGNYGATHFFAWGDNNYEGMGRKQKEYKKLTIEDVRKYKGFENASDEELHRILRALEKLSLLIFKKFVTKEIKSAKR